MPEETFVFVGQQAGHELAGKTVCRRETPLPVRCDPCPQQLPVGRIEQGGAGLRKECPGGGQMQDRSYQQLYEKQVEDNHSPFGFTPLS